MKKVYLIGVKGVGMAALAVYLKEAGYEVEGSDNSVGYVTDEILLKHGINIFSPFDKDNLKDKNPDFVIVSAAYDDSNVEVKEAIRKKMVVKYYSEILADITRDKKLIAVAGIHGKTTTTSLIALLLKRANLDPSFIIGAAKVPLLEASSHFGQGDYFVLEADEYRQSPNNPDSKFLTLSPEFAIISSIELDHPDVFGSVEDIYQAFYRFACRVPRNGKIILNIDYPKSKKLDRSLVDRSFETYGFSNEASWQIIDLIESARTSFSLKHGRDKFGPYTLQVPGKHNVLNATTAVILAKMIGIDEKILKETLEEFRGAQRRFEIIGESNDVSFIDDYAHHPTAIKTTLEAVKTKFPESKIWCIFQPHTFSRTKSLLKEFGESFPSADKIIITDIYASAREKEGGVSAIDLVNEIKNNRGNVQYINNWDKIRKYLRDFVNGKSVIITIGAGDIYKLGQEIFKDFKEKADGKK